MKPLLERAEAFATHAHRNQLYGELPYAVHLAEVVSNLREFGFGDDQELLAAGWLHDVMEDCNVPTEQIGYNFGPRVRYLVYAVTNESGANRSERALKTYPKIRVHHDAVALKLADRIANVRRVGKMLGKYKQEYPGFRDALYRQGEHEAMWEALGFWMR
jgi:guanosine-3',5'-bis(diphosphate) 3'-pyrophosphohydrolase